MSYKHFYLSSFLYCILYCSLYCIIFCTVFCIVFCISGTCEKFHELHHHIMVFHYLYSVVRFVKIGKWDKNTKISIIRNNTRRESKINQFHEFVVPQCGEVSWDLRKILQNFGFQTISFSP